MDEPLAPVIEEVAPQGSFIVRSLATASSRLMDLPTRYGMHFLIVARLPIAQVGSFYIVFGMMTLFSGFGRVGVDKALTREVAASLAHDKPEVARKAIGRVLLHVTAQSCAIVAVTASLAHLICLHVFHDATLARLLMLGLVAIIPQNVGVVAAGALLGFGRVATSQMIHQWLWPGVFCIGALVLHIDAYRALELIVGAMVVNMIVGLGLMVQIMPRRHAHAQHVVAPPMVSLGMQLFTAELVMLAISSLPQLAIGHFSTKIAVGQYALAWRIVLMLNLLVSAMGAVASPQFARAAAKKDKATLRRVSSQTVGLTVLLSVFPAIVLAINPTFFLSRFGSGYDAATPTLRALLIGQSLLILCAGVPELLGMTGHERALLKVNVVSATVLLVGLVGLTPRLADVGAALATSAAMAVNAIGVTLAARSELGLFPLANFFRDVSALVRRTLRPV